MSEPLAAVRLDRWLWAARFYKTRPLAVAAVEGGKVQVNGDRVKRSKIVKPGDQVRIRQDPYEYLVEVTGMAEKRGSAKVAATLYQESAESLAAREELAFRMNRRRLRRHVRRLHAAGQVQGALGVRQRHPRGGTSLGAGLRREPTGRQHQLQVPPCYR